VNRGDAVARQSLHHLGIGAADFRVHDMHGGLLFGDPEEPIVLPQKVGRVIAIQARV
jgi:hypothetical protein